MGPGQITLIVLAVLAAAAVVWLVARPQQDALPAKPEPKALEPKDKPEGKQDDPEVAPDASGTSEPPDDDEGKSDEPDAKADEPDAKADEPEAKSDEPDAKSDAKSDEPDAKSDEPDAKADEPDAKSDEPDAKSDEPDAKSDEPEVKADELASESSEPSKDEASPWQSASNLSLSSFSPPKMFAPPPSIGGKKPKLAAPKISIPKPAEPKQPELAETKQPEPAEPKQPEPAETKQPEPAETKQPEPAETKPEARAPVPMPVEKPKVPTREEREQAELEAKKDERERYRLGLRKTKRGFINRLARLFRGKPKVSDDLKDDIEEVLFTADIGAKTAEALLASVTAELDKKDVADADAVWSVIRQKALDLLDIDAEPLDYAPELGPHTLLMIGVNGVGKTTTLGKLAARHVEAGRKTLLVAGDTYRAAAGEQLEVWARRVGCDIHLGKDGADPSSVIFDGISRGREEGYDVVLCDTAGRLHTRKELMDELGKMGRSAAKALSKGRDAMEPHDIFLALDATIGQNALAQAQMFKETMAFSGLVLTKLDGTAKGGVVLGIVDELRIPIRYIGIGEAVDDLRRFDPEAFCDVLFKPDEDGAGDDGADGDDDDKDTE